MLEHIIKVRDSLNQVVVDKDFIIVDNRKEEHRYKYDHQTSYISKEEVEETAKVAKWI